MSFRQVGRSLYGQTATLASGKLGAHCTFAQSRRSAAETAHNLASASPQLRPTENYRKLSWKSTTYASSGLFTTENTKRQEGQNTFATKERTEHKERIFSALRALLRPVHVRLSSATNHLPSF